MANQHNATKILIVDDNKLICAVLTVMLRSEGYEVVGELSNGDNFIRAVDRLEPDIICLDHDMPGKDGLELLSQVKEIAPSVAVVMITGVQDPAIQQQAVAAGVAGFLTKPFNQQQVLGELKQVDHARKLLKNPGNLPNSNDIDIKLVLADDSSLMRDLLAAIVKSMGISIVGEAHDGKEALDIIEQQKPHAICLDLDMPVMDGFEALEKIKATHPDIKVIIVSGIAEREKVKRAIELGACGYIIKPYETQQVIQTLSKVLL